MSYHSLLLENGDSCLRPPLPETIAETDVSEGFLCDLALRHVALLPDPTTDLVAERLHLSRTLTEDLLSRLYQEKLIEKRMLTAPGLARYAMLERGWERVSRTRSVCGYVGPAPVSLQSYTNLIRLQSLAASDATKDTIQAAFSDLVLPETLLQTLGYVATSRRSLFLTGLPGTGKTAIAERINAALPGTVWIPYAIEIDGQVIRVFDAHNHRPVAQAKLPPAYDRRWICIERPLVIVGGELELADTDLAWSEVARFYEAPFQMKANGGTLVIDDFGRQRVAPHDLLNRWIVPLERRMDYLTLQTGKKIEVPFDQLVVFSTNLEEKDLVDEAFLRRMGYRARIEPPPPPAYVKIFTQVALARGIHIDDPSLTYLLQKYEQEKRQMKACEPRDLLERVKDICLFEGFPMILTPALIDSAWQNYFGTAHNYDNARPVSPMPRQANGTPSAIEDVVLKSR